MGWVSGDVMSLPGHFGVIVWGYDRLNAASDAVLRGTLSTARCYLKILFIVTSCAAIPGQDDLSNEVNHPFLTDPKFLQLTDQVQSLMGFANSEADVQVLW